MSIQKKIVVLIVGSIIAVSVVLGGAADVLMNRFLRYQVDSNLKKSSDKIADKVNVFLAERRLEIERLKKNKTIRLFFTSKDSGDLIQVQDLLLFVSRYYNVLSLLDAKGMEVVKIANGLPSVVYEDRSKEEYFARAVKQEAQAQGMVCDSSLESGERVYSTGILNSYEELAGVVSGQLSYSVLNEIIGDLKTDKTGVGYIVDRDGNFILHPDKKKILKGKIRISATGSGNVTDEIRKLQSGVARAELEGVDSLIAYTPIKDLGWSVVMAMPYDDFARASRTLGKSLLAAGLLSIAIFVTISLYIAKGVVRPIRDITAMVKDIAEGEGDLSARLALDNKDEISELAKWFNVFIANLQEIIRNIATNAEVLNRTSADLSQHSELMSAKSYDMSSKSNNVAVGAGQMSSNLNLISKTMDQASERVNMIASFAVEMSATIAEIAKKTEQARTISNEAVSQSARSSDKVNRLGKMAQEIGKLVETITDISEQTNLLALNATIESARAGDAGKGFAVVANEIKDLAKQTANSTLIIKKQIKEIQESTLQTVDDISDISKTILTVNEIISLIAAATEEQSVTTREIAGNVAETSQGVAEVNVNVTQSSTAAEGIAQDIFEVNRAAAGITDNSSQVKQRSEELATLARQLQELVGKFKV